MKKILLCMAFFTMINSVEAYSNQLSNKLIIYYFHRTARCSSCLLLEKITRDSVSIDFEKQIKAGQIELKIINIEETGNTHFEDHYKLTNQSVVLSIVANGTEQKWKNLAKVWDYLHERDQLIDYIQSEINLITNFKSGKNEKKYN